MVFSGSVVKCVLLAGLLAGLIIGNVQAEWMEEHTGSDMLGSDYKVGSGDEIAAFIYSANPDECAQMCLDDPKCKAATYMVPNGRYGSIAKCWLKDAVPSITADSLCTSWVKMTDDIPPGGGTGCYAPAPIAEFNLATIADREQRTSGFSPARQIGFVALGAKNILRYEWNFGDGTVFDNGGTVPSHAYTSPGKYTVSLTGHGPCGDIDTETKTGYITIIDPTLGTLSVTSAPSGATVSIDGDAQGSTPISGIKLSEGAHTVLLILAGYEDYSRDVMINRNEPVQLQVSLTKKAEATPSTGSILVATDPTGASVSVDGTARGTTPVTITDLSAGQHTVSVTKDGYADYSAKVTVTGSETLPLSLTLVPLPATTARPSTQAIPEETTTPVTTGNPSGFGTLNIQSDPQGASITLDGEPIGKTPIVVRNVEIGKHTIVLSLAGYNESRLEIDVEEGEITEAGTDFTTGKKTPGFPAVAAISAIMTMFYFSVRPKKE